MARVLRISPGFLQCWAATQAEWHTGPQVSELARKGGGELSQALKRLRFNLQPGHKISTSPWATQFSTAGGEDRVCPVHPHLRDETIFHNTAVKKHDGPKNYAIFHLVPPPPLCSSHDEKWQNTSLFHFRCFSAWHIITSQL